MWQRHEKGTGSLRVSTRAVAMSDGGTLSISSGLMDELGRPETVDVYADREQRRIGVTPGTEYRVSGAKGTKVGTVCTSGALSAMGILPHQRLARPKFEMATHEGQLMLVVWPEIEHDEEAGVAAAPALPEESPVCLLGFQSGAEATG